MSFESGTTSLLPPFGIKELYDSRAGILQISKAQYDSTVSSYPEAVLTYVDDDDGEVITVGSGLELQQRLDEPIRHRGRVQAAASRRGSVDDSMVHIFDIQHSDKVLAVWRDHEAYSSKDSPRDLSPVPVPTSPGLQQAVSPPPAESSAQQPSTAERPTTPTANTNAPSDILQDIDTVLAAACKGLESLGLPEILDNTAQALHSLAQKTRDTDTTPVEALLGGLRDVVTQVGKLGLEILDGLDDNDGPPAAKSASVNTPSSTPVDNAECTCGVKSEAARLALKMKKMERKDAKAAAKEQRREEKKARRQERVVQREARRADKKATPTSAPEEDAEDIAGEKVQKDDAESGPTLTGLDAAGAGRPLFDRLTNAPSSNAPVSIMDIESSNADFTARYPPLASLRLAQSVSDMAKRNMDAALGKTLPPTASPTDGPLDAHMRMHQDMLSHINQATVNLRTQPPGAMLPDTTKALPGSWPEGRADQTGVHPVTESSGAFFNRMAGMSPKRPLSPAVSCRATSPAVDQGVASTGLGQIPLYPLGGPRITVSPVDQEAPAAAGLGRSHTVTSARSGSLYPLTNVPRVEPLLHRFQPQRSLSLQHGRQMNGPLSARAPSSWFRPPPPPPAPPAPLLPFSDCSTASRGDGQNKAAECVQTLTNMGYGMVPNEAARLHVYASASGGNLDEAIDMIEEDRKAAEALRDRREDRSY